MPPDEVARIVSAVASALDYAHKQGLLHRDVKPANIMITDPDDGVRRVMLADFGIARNVGEISGLTAINLILGTVTYAAPRTAHGVGHRRPCRPICFGGEGVSSAHRRRALRPNPPGRGDQRPPDCSPARAQ